MLRVKQSRRDAEAPRAGNKERRVPLPLPGLEGKESSSGCRRGSPEEAWLFVEARESVSFLLVPPISYGASPLPNPIISQREGVIC